MAKPKEKFYFDLNNFDDAHINAEDAVPTFSEEELTSAKKEAFEEGRKQGLNEAAQSREQATASALTRLTQNFSALFTAESVREKQFEEETLRLTLKTIKTLFPLLNKRYGMEELRAAVQNTLQSHEEQTEVLIELHPDAVEDIQSLLDQTESLSDTKKRRILKANDAIAAGDCKISWKDGGCVRKTGELVQNIAQELEKLLGDALPAEEDNEGASENKAKSGAEPDAAQETAESDKNRAEDAQSALETAENPDKVTDADDGEES